MQKFLSRSVGLILISCLMAACTPHSASHKVSWQLLLAVRSSRRWESLRPSGGVAASTWLLG